MSLDLSIKASHKQRFELYGLYKDGQYEIPTDATSVKEEVEETKAVKMKEAVKNLRRNLKSETTQDLISEYKRLSSRLTIR